MAQRRLTVVRTPPTRTEIQRAAETLGETEQKFLDCRDLRHAWDWVGAPFYVGAEIHRRLVCMRCGTTATDVWSSKAKRLARNYHYAKGYSTKGVRIRPIDVRKEVLNRTQTFASEEDMMTWMVSSRARKRA